MTSYNVTIYGEVKNFIIDPEVVRTFANETNVSVTIMNSVENLKIMRTITDDVKENKTVKKNEITENSDSESEFSDFDSNNTDSSSDHKMNPIKSLMDDFIINKMKDIIQTRPELTYSESLNEAQLEWEKIFEEPENTEYEKFLVCMMKELAKTQPELSDSELLNKAQSEWEKIHREGPEKTSACCSHDEKSHDNASDVLQQKEHEKFLHCKIEELERLHPELSFNDRIAEAFISLQTRIANPMLYQRDVTFANQSSSVDESICQKITNVSIEDENNYDDVEKDEDDSDSSSDDSRSDEVTSPQFVSYINVERDEETKRDLAKFRTEYDQYVRNLCRIMNGHDNYERPDKDDVFDNCVIYFQFRMKQLREIHPDKSDGELIDIIRDMWYRLNDYHERHLSD